MSNFLTVATVSDINTRLCKFSCVKVLTSVQEEEDKVEMRKQSWRRRMTIRKKC